MTREANGNPTNFSENANGTDGLKPPFDSLLAPGGKVDPDLVRAAANQENADEALRVTFRLTRDLQKRLDKYLQDRIPFMSRTHLQRLIKEEAVTVNGRLPKASTVLRLNDEVVVIVPPPPTNEIPAEDIPLRVLFEDEHLIVLNKQCDLIVHPARGNKTGTMINALAWHFQHHSTGALSEVGRDEARPGVVHRLDRYTTGAIVAAKTDLAHWRISKQFANRTVDKRYLALVEGTVEPVADEVDLPIGKHPRFKEMMAVRYEETAKQSFTIYRVREQFDGYALVELELKTGRTHQIRVHMAHLGWPLVGDDLYDGKWLYESSVVPGGSAETELMSRQALHATTLSFDHPISGERLNFTAPLWEDMRHTIQLLREHRRLSGPIQPAGATVDIDLLLIAE